MTSSVIIISDDASLENIELSHLQWTGQRAGSLIGADTRFHRDPPIYSIGIENMDKYQPQKIFYLGNTANILSRSFFDGTSLVFSNINLVDLSLSESARDRFTDIDNFKTVEKIIYIYGEDHISYVGNKHSGNFAFSGGIDCNNARFNFTLCAIAHGARITGIPFFIVGNQISINQTLITPTKIPPFYEKTVIRKIMKASDGNSPLNGTIDEEADDLLSYAKYSKFNKYEKIMR